MAAQTRSASSRNRGAIICSLSDDLVLHVFSFLQARLLWLMVQLNRRFKRIAEEDILWHALLSAEVGRSNLPSMAIGTPMAAGRSRTWRKRFLQWQRLESCDCEEQEPSLDDGERSPQVRLPPPARRRWPATCEPADASRRALPDTLPRGAPGLLPSHLATWSVSPPPPPPYPRGRRDFCTAPLACRTAGSTSLEVRVRMASSTICGCSTRSVR